MIQLKQYGVVGQELALSWSDGREQYLNLTALRKACPCAQCAGEPDTVGKPAVKPEVSYPGPESFQLRVVQPVGGYGLQLTWADGHSTGIYSFDYLRGF